MVSILLLTTEEILQKNSFWQCLDTVWFTEELEPFEEVKAEHIFIKPLSRDYYYTRYPDIPRSESDDENSLSLIGFKSKHEEWKSKISVRRFCAQRRHLRHSRLSWNGIRSARNNSFNNEPRRAISLIENRSSNISLSTKSCMSFENEKPSKSNDERVRDFFKRLLESVPPPPLETQIDSLPDIISCSIAKPTKYQSELSNVDIPGYADFERDKILQTENERGLLPTSSTLKKAQRRVSFNLNTSKAEFESNESWYDSIYGISGIMMATSVENIIADADENLDDQDYYPSWSEILMECKVNHSNIRSKESSLTSEELLSRSHVADAKVIELDNSIDEETEYARFAIYKIHQTMTIQGHMLDSSSMVDLTKYECNLDKKSQKDPAFFGTVYRLAHNSFDDSQEVL